MKRQTRFFDSTTMKLILINVVAYVLIVILGAIYGDAKVLSYLALQPEAIIQGEKLWTIITSVFSHYMFFHLFVNMFSLYFLGSFIEKLIGKKRFVIFYLTAGIFASIFTAFLSGYLSLTPTLTRVLGDPSVLALGASGAIFGLVGILAVITPRVKIFFLAGPLLAFIVMALLPQGGIYELVSLLVMAYLFISIFSMMSLNPQATRYALPVQLSMWVLPIIAIVPLIVISIFIDLPIGNMAHFGGLLCGLGYAGYLRSRYPKRSKMISKMYSQ